VEKNEPGNPSSVDYSKKAVRSEAVRARRDVRANESGKRVFLPAAAVFVVMSASWIIYTLAWQLASSSLHQPLATISGTLLFVSVTFGALYVYSAMYFKGAPPSLRIAVCFVNPFLWMTKECARLYISYSFAECLYYYLNPLNVWLVLGIVAQMGLAEMFCRWRAAAKGREIGAFSPGGLAAFVIGLFLVVSLFAWGQGENAYVVFLSGYRQFFGSGL
jgi:hypothetical protein